MTTKDGAYCSIFFLIDRVRVSKGTFKVFEGTFYHPNPDRKFLRNVIIFGRKVLEFFALE